MSKRPEPILWLSDARGIYLPRDFANSFVDRAKRVTGVSDDEWDVLEAGPDHEHYWDAWCEVQDRARVTDPNGVVYHVYQSGDCWLVPAGMEWSDNAGWFVWPKEEEG